MRASAAGAAWAATAGAIPAESPRPKGPNIIFILADDLGYGDLGCYGQKVIQTPRIDRMAAEGLRFTQCYAGSTVCAPSRCCLMTGLHSGHAWIRGNARLPLRPEDVTVAEVMKEAGYTTGLIGKWGLGNEETTGTPNKQGFDEFFGYLDQKHAHNYYPEYLWRNEEKVRLEGNIEEKPEVSSERVQYTPDLFTEEALSFVTRHREHPFFLYLAYTIPHANNERGGAKGDGMETPSYAPYEDKDWPTPQKGHAAMVTRLDRDVGRVLDKVAELGLDNDTLIFFSSDNGPHQEGGGDPEFFDSSGPLRGLKRDLYEGGIRVPMIARWPGKVPAGTTSDLVLAFWDFLPTAAQIASVVPPEGLDGHTVVPELVGRHDAQPEHDYLYWEFYERGFSQAARQGNWKAVRPKAGEPTELYDLSADLGEAKNVAGDHPDIATRLESLFQQAHVPSPHWQPKT
ncbi:MAG: arylsulfatase [Candidatus Hydrogenedentes bacterium]|nr:arylsulfatase [Candidatus Hydrogenedentota bacterium]